MDLGNLVCWTGGFTFDLCCHPSFGPDGNEECWIDGFTPDFCCESPQNAEDACWSEAAYFISRSREPIADYLTQHTMKKFCCYPTAFTSQMCWGTGVDGGHPMIDDPQTREFLNFTARYVQCCMPSLREMIQSGHSPTWMSDQIDDDLRPWVRDAPFTIEDLDDFERELEVAGQGSAFCRFSIRGNVVNHCDFERSGYKPLGDAFRNALSVLQVLLPLPDVDLFVNMDEFHGIFGSGRPEKLNLVNLTVPALVQAEPVGGKGILIPWWAYMQLEWTTVYGGRMDLASSKRHWDSRSPLLFWRGSDTGCILPGGCADSLCECLDWQNHTWLSSPRSRLVLLSSMLPQRIDAKYTKNIVHEELTETFTANNLWIDELIPPDAHVKYKYLAYIDGTSFSDRMYWIMLSGSLVFRVSSQLRVWLDGALRPWDHYIPVLENISDLVEQIEWAREHDVEASEIASKGQDFAKQHLSLQSNIYYLYILISRISKLMKLPERGADASESPSQRTQDLQFAAQHKTTPATQAREANAVERPNKFYHRIMNSVENSSNGEISSLECWTFGFTPKVCCDVDLFGPAGNPSCWDGPYSFETCCVGKFASLEFWIKQNEV